MNSAVILSWTLAGNVWVVAAVVTVLPVGTDWLCFGRFDAFIVAAEINLADFVVVVVGAGIDLVPVSGLAFILDVVVEMNSAVILSRTLAGNVWVVAAVVTVLPVGTDWLCFGRFDAFIVAAEINLADFVVVVVGAGID